MALDKILDAEGLKTWILRRLGAPVVKVELTDCHLGDAIDDAKRWFAAKKGVENEALVHIYSNQSEYNLDTLTEPGVIDKVLEFAFPVRNLDLSLVFSPYLLLEEKVPYDVFSSPASLGIYSSYAQTIQYIEQAKRILGAEPEWRQDGRLLRVAPMPKTDGTGWLKFSTSQFSIETLSERDHDLLKRYALAIAKEMLGRIRSKYDGYPTAQGSVNLDGDKLLEESRTDIEALNEEIGESAKPMFFVTG